MALSIPISRLDLHMCQIRPKLVTHALGPDHGTFKFILHMQKGVRTARTMRRIDRDREHIRRRRDLRRGLVPHREIGPDLDRRSLRGPAGPLVRINWTEVNPDQDQEAVKVLRKGLSFCSHNVDDANCF